MSEQLGKIEKPAVEEYKKKGRKLYFIPLIFIPKNPEEEFVKIVNRYWEEVEVQLTSLEKKLGEAICIYHELVPIGGEKGAKIIEELNKGSYQIVKSRLDRGASLLPIEEEEILTEFMDWSKCLTIDLQNQKVSAKIYEFFTDVQQRRNRHIEKQIDETLKENETAILLMQEGHQIQFPQDLQVFYIAPPVLDEAKRWIRTYYWEK